MRFLSKMTAFTFLFVFLPPSFTLAEWNLPAGMEWHMKSGDCAFSGERAPLLKGCYFGVSGSEKNVGLAFFRICGAVRETNPFYVVNFKENSYELDYDVDGIFDEKYSLEEMSLIDPIVYFREVNAWLGSCWLPEDSV